MSQIKYRISSVSSEHPKYPAANLISNQDGWQSSINCSYPQSLTIQFYIPIRTKRVLILFHQYKIPKLVEVFIKLGCRSNYRKLGYIMPNDNSQSSFQEKQQKTMHFEFSCTHIRLVIHENYKNDMNIFNQVAIEDLIVIGEILSHKQIGAIDLTEEDSSEDEAVESVEISHNQRTLERAENKEQQFSNSSSSPLFKDIYAKLEIEKEQAVEREQYQKASQIKNILVNFKNLQNQINRLEKEKVEALRQQDYDRCHRIKNEIIKKKEVVQFQRDSLFNNEEQFYSQNTFSRIVQRDVSPLNESKRKENPTKDMLQFKSPEFERRNPNPSMSSSVTPHDEQIIPALLNKGKQKGEMLPLETNEKRKDLPQMNQSIIPQQQQEEEGNTSLKKDLYQIKQYTDREAESSMANEQSVIQLQPLQMKLKMRVQNYFDFLPEQLWQLCQNKNWRGKLEAIKFLKEKMPYIQTKEHFLAVFQMISRIIVSKQAVISIEVLQILYKLTQSSIKFTLQHLPFFVEDIIGQLLNYLNDTNSKIKELAYTTYFRLPRISFLNISVVIRELIRHKNKVKKDPKLIITKLQLMTLIVQNYKEAEYNFKEITNWTLAYLEDPSQKVRSTAADLLIALTYLVSSERLLKAIEELKRPELVEMVLNMMNSSLDLSKANNNQQSKLSLQNSKLHQQFFGPTVGQKSEQPSNRKVPSVQPIYAIPDQKQKMQQSKNSKKDSENANFQLSYSRQSMYEQSAGGSNSRRNKNNDNLRQQNDIRVLEDEGEAEDMQEDVCIYCHTKFQDERTHYLQDCKVLAHCDKCNSLIYLREFTDHLLNECEESHMFRLCKKCGLAFEIGQINEHIAKDTCKKKLGVNWERCQFCSSDVLAEDKLWIQHALQCHSLPEKRFLKNQQEGDVSMQVSR